MTVMESHPSFRVTSWYLFTKRVRRWLIQLVATFTVGAAAKAASDAGEGNCISCHESVVRSYRDSAHARTSEVGGPLSIKGRFEEGKNELRTSNPLLYFRMESRPDGFYESAIAGEDAAKREYRAEKIDVVIGSGRKGQTYLYWNGEKLFQLPVSYLTTRNAWINSPGYLDGTANFERPILPRCLECHTSHVVSRAPPNGYDAANLHLGISCERCHGSGTEHSHRYSLKKPEEITDSAIVNPSRLSRERAIDVCGVCHQGAGEPKGLSHAFVPGDDLRDHFTFPDHAPGERLDVHGNQVQLLESSQCFQKSPSLTCTTCHNVHRQERDIAAFAAKCLSCHTVESCGEFPKRGGAISSECVVCHMPLEASGLLEVSHGQSPREHLSVRNHRIGIYPEQQ